MSIPQKNSHPVIVGMYADGFSPLYGTPWDDLPCPGLALVPSFLGDIDPATVDSVSTARQAAFDHDQLHGSLHAVLMHNVGFVVDERGVTLYCQYQLPWYSRPIDETTYVAEPDPFDPLFPLVPYAAMGPRPTYPAPSPPRAGAPDFPPAPGTSPPAGWLPSR